jgi:hypothetical protein
LQAADVIEKNVCVKLKTGWECYAKACIEEYKNGKCVKTLKYTYKSTDARDFFSRNLPIVIVYKSSLHGPTAYVVMKVNGINWANLIEKLQWPNLQERINKHVSEKLNNCFKTALGFASTEMDRHILKLIISKITGVTYMTEHGIDGLKFNRQSLQVCNLKTENVLNKWCNSKPKSRYENEKNKKDLNFRQKGSGRQPIGMLYPDLVACMLYLFDSSGKGLQTHPRLICETLYVKEKSWVDIPRAVSIMNQVYGIPISLSSAYTYTENYTSSETS